MKKVSNIIERSIPISHGERTPPEGHLSGYAALYNTEYRYQIRDKHDEIINIIEVILPGAFTSDLIERSDVRATVNHDPNIVLARSNRGQGTLSLTADAAGLYFDMVPPKSAGAYVESVQRKDIDQCSYKYIADEEVVTQIDDTTFRVEVKSYKELKDITLATYPAYESTSVLYQERTLASINKFREEEDPNQDWEEKSKERERSLQILSVGATTP